MARKHNTKKSRFSSPLKVTSLPPRTSRHGKLLTDVFRVAVPAVIERKVVLNEASGEYEVQVIELQPVSERPMRPDEMREARTRLRAVQPTSRRRSLKNEPENMAPKGRKMSK